MKCSKCKSDQLVGFVDGTYRCVDCGNMQKGKILPSNVWKVVIRSLFKGETKETILGADKIALAMFFHNKGYEPPPEGELDKYLLELAEETV